MSGTWFQVVPILACVSLFQLFLTHQTFTALTGALPESIGNWGSVQEVHLHENCEYVYSYLSFLSLLLSILKILFFPHHDKCTALTGKLPESIGNWANVEEVFLYDNGMFFASSAFIISLIFHTSEPLPRNIFDTFVIFNN